MKVALPARSLAWVIALLVIWVVGAQAQLPTSYSNLTGIKVTRLPNAVVVRIETDGTVQFGGDFRDWIDVDNGYNLKPTQSVRLRLVQTRSKLPAYVPIDAYPLDGAAITLGRTPFDQPFFSDGGWSQTPPLVDVELRFATPVTIRKFTVQPYRSTWFGDYVGPREASIELSPDRRAIIVTLIPDRTDLTGAQRLERSPEASRKHELSVVPLPDGAFAVRALHAKMGDLLSSVWNATGQNAIASGDLADVPVSLCLPRARFADLLRALESATNCGVREQNGTPVLGRGDEFFDARSLPLSNISPDTARLLFPDFLLPFLRPDRGNNALLAVQSPAVLDKIAAELARVDTPRAMFEVSAQFYELSSTRDDTLALQLLRSLGGDRETFDLSGGTFSVKVAPGQTAQLGADLQLLSSRNRARLLGSARSTVLSGASGKLFLGQTRYISVLQNTYNGQTSNALALQVGAQFDVSPRGSNQSGDPIRLDIAPRLSTVDDIEAKTGLPTIGIRELSGSLLLNEGDSVVFAGLDLDLDARFADRALRFVPSRRRSNERRALLVLVSARRVPSDPKTSFHPA